MTAPLPMPSWLRIKQHAEESIDGLRTSLETASPDAVLVMQAQIRVWRQVIDLPALLSDETVAPDSQAYG